METYQIKITPQAQTQMRKIAAHIACELSAPVAALRLVDALEEAVASLSRLPRRIPLTEEEPWRTQGVHKMHVRNFFVYF